MPGTGFDLTLPRSFIGGSDHITSILLYQNYLYVANFTKNAIEMYDAESGLPLNIFTRRVVTGNEDTHSYTDINSVDGPYKMVLGNGGGDRDRIYLCNYNQNIVAFDLLMGFAQIRFSNGEIGNEYLDVSMLHYHPLDVVLSSSDLMDRIVVLYHGFGYVIYDGRGTRLNTIELGDLPSYRHFTYIDHNHLYIKTIHLSSGVITKYDKNGIVTNFRGDDYGNEVGKIADCDAKNGVVDSLLLSGDLRSPKRVVILYSQMAKDTDKILHILSNNMIYITDFDGNVLHTTASPIPLTGNCSFTFDWDHSLLWIMIDQTRIYKVHIDFDLLFSPSSSMRNKGNMKMGTFAISYERNSRYYPTTNMEVIQYMVGKREVYAQLLRAFDLSKKYISENKEYFYLYNDLNHHTRVKIPHYELIFILQQKFMMNLSQYRVDPFILKFPQHFGSVEYRDLDIKYRFYQQASKRELYLDILYTYYQALFYQSFLENLRKVVEYDSYLNLADDIKLNVDCRWNGMGLFPRVCGNEVRRSYNKKQCEVLQKFFL